MKTTEKKESKRQVFKKNFFKYYKNLSTEEKEEIQSNLICLKLNGGLYSAFNTINLAYSGGNGGVYGGFKQWKEQNKKVKKGSKGFFILYPYKFGKKGEGEEQGEEKKAVTSFGVGVVFHESQVENLV